MNPNDNRLDILTYQGVPFSDAITLEDAAGDPFPLASRLVTADIWGGSPDDPGVLAMTVNEASGMIARDTGTGVITRTLTAAALESLAVGDYWYELIVWDAAGEVIVDRPCWGFHQHVPCAAGAPA